VGTERRAWISVNKEYGTVKGLLQPKKIKILFNTEVEWQFVECNNKNNVILSKNFGLMCTSYLQVFTIEI